MPTKPDSARGSFAAVLASLRPNTDNEMAEELTKLVEAVKATGKKGTLSVTFEVKPLDGGGGAVIINDKITAKRPERTREGSIAYVDINYNLTRNDPTQMPLFDEDIRDTPDYADPRTGEIKEPPAV